MLLTLPTTGWGCHPNLFVRTYRWRLWVGWETDGASFKMATTDGSFHSQLLSQLDLTVLEWEVNFAVTLDWSAYVNIVNKLGKRCVLFFYFGLDKLGFTAWVVSVGVLGHAHSEVFSTQKKKQSRWLDKDSTQKWTEIQTTLMSGWSAWWRNKRTKGELMGRTYQADAGRVCSKSSAGSRKKEKGHPYTNRQRSTTKRGGNETHKKIPQISNSTAVTMTNLHSDE